MSSFAFLKSLAVFIGLFLAVFSVPARATTFEVVGAQILKDGAPFVAKGVNINGPNWVWERGSAQDAESIVNLWKFNLVRVDCSIETIRASENDDLAALVAAFSARDCVVMLEVHDYTGIYASPASQTILNDWWAARATQFKDNPYVWFNIANEPGGASPASSDWMTMHQSAINAIRATSARNIVICDENDWGTASASKPDATIATSDSAALTYGPNLRDSYGNVAFSIHVYHQWNAGGAAKLSDYITRVQNAGISILVGEWGQRAFAPYESVTATKAMFGVVRAKNVGRVAWHWYPGDDNKLTAETNSWTPGGGWLVDVTDGSRPANLSWMGELAWDDNRGAALIIDNQPTPLDRTGWTASASNSYGENTPAKVLDGSFGDYFHPTPDYLSGAALADGQWLQIDMQSAKTLNRVDVSTQPSTFGPFGYKIYLSSDAQNPGTAITTFLGKQSEKRISFPSATGRFLRIETTGGLNWGGWWNIFEINAYGTNAPVLGQGTGLKGQYFADKNLTRLVKTQLNPQINFNWGSGGPKNGDNSPMSSVGPDNFSVRWTGQIQALEAGTYTFTTTTDDGARLWVNNQLVIDKWRSQSATAWSGTISLAAGQKASLKMEYFEANGNASARLNWKRPGASSSVVVPTSQLYPAP